MTYLGLYEIHDSQATPSISYNIYLNISKGNLNATRTVEFTLFLLSPSSSDTCCRGGLRRSAAGPATTFHFFCYGKSCSSKWCPFISFWVVVFQFLIFDQRLCARRRWDKCLGSSDQAGLRKREWDAQNTIHPCVCVEIIVYSAACDILRVPYLNFFFLHTNGMQLLAHSQWQ